MSIKPKIAAKLLMAGISLDTPWGAHSATSNPLAALDGREKARGGEVEKGWWNREGEKGKDEGKDVHLITKSWLQSRLVLLQLTEVQFLCAVH
jgi:hypothetical protein